MHPSQELLVTGSGWSPNAALPHRPFASLAARSSCIEAQGSSRHRGAGGGGYLELQL